MYCPISLINDAGKLTIGVRLLKPLVIGEERSSLGPFTGQLELLEVDEVVNVTRKKDRPLLRYMGEGQFIF